MASGDGSVDIRITGSVDPSVAASANQAKASMSGLGEATAGFSAKATVSNAAMKTLVAQTGSWDKAIKALTAANGDVAAAIAATTAAEEINTVATKANTGAAINSRAAYEATVLIHEAMQGRFSRMAGSSMILTQQLAGQAATTRLVQFAMTGYGLAIIAVVATIGLVIAATVSYSNEQKKLTETTLGLGAQSGLTARQLKDIGESATAASQSIRETTKAAEAFAGAGLHDAETVKVLSNSVYAYSQLIGTKFAEAQKSLAEAMKDPVKGAKELHEQLGILDGDQMQQIETLTALGRKDEAVAIITQALAHRLDEARQAGLGTRGAFGQLIDVVSNLYEKIGQLNAAFEQEKETLWEHLIPALGRAAQAHRDVAAAAAHQAQNEAQLNTISARGAAAYAETPEGRALTERTQLQGKLNAAKDALAVDTAVHGAHSEVVRRDRQAVEDYGHAVRTYLTEVQKKTRADQLDVQIAAARHSRNRQLVTDLTEQKALLTEAGKVESEADARALAKGRGDVAGGRVFPKTGGSKGPSVVSEWSEQLHTAEILSNNFFADQTENELKFWQGKLALTKTGSKDWLEVQSKIYEASKTLARRDYDEHIADLDDRLEADRSDFKKVQADWEEKLNYIKSKFGQESTEYKNAHRQMLAEERHHEEEMLQAELSGNSKAIQALKAHLQAEEQTRRTYASAAESLIQQSANGQVFGEIKAASQIAQLHQQLAAQELADARAAFQAEEALRQKGLADAKKFYGQDSAAYKKALQDDVNAQKAFQDQVRQLQAKGYAQQVQDLNRLKQAYHSYIDGTVNAAVSGLANMLDGTGTWRDAVIGIYNSLKSAIEQVISQIITNWIVNLLVGKAAQQTANEATALSYVGVAGAAGVASWAGAPWPIDAGAPAFGASMAAAAAGYATLAALDQGTNYLPQDQIVQAHEGERIIPKADNRKLMEMMSVAISGSGGGGDMHFHSSPTFNGNQASMWDHMVKTHEREMMRWFGRKFKNSGFDKATA
jgi:hypothetical protein